MRVLIDADGCPVVDITVNLSRQYGIPCILFADTAHRIIREGAQTRIIDQGADSVDFAIANEAKSGDIVITQDYGVASMCLGKKARVLHQDGWEYTLDNISALLFERHEARKYRASGGRTKGPKKRTGNQNTAFALSLQRLFQQAVQG